MTHRKTSAAWTRALQRQWVAITRMATAAGQRALARAPRAPAGRRSPPAATGAWIPGVALGLAGARRFRLYRPPGMAPGERLPVMVMLHGCGQTAESFAASTRMNRVAQRERFLVLYPEQDRLANAQGCWNWFDTDAGRAQAEMALILKAIDQIGLLHQGDMSRVAVVGLSAGASMAALLATRHPDRIRAVVMHSGVPPGQAHSTLSALGAMHGRHALAPMAAPEAPGQAAWPPLLVIHGSSDVVVSPRNAPAAVKLWAEAAGALPTPARQVQRGRRHAMQLTDFKHLGQLAATLAVVSGLAHAWSGGAASQPFSDAQGPDASRMAWAFAKQQFQRQSRRQGPTALKARTR